MERKITLLDGAMGTELRNRGCTIPSHLDSIWSAQALIDHPDIVRRVHEDYIAAGADIIIANNYAVTQDLLARVDRRHQLQELTNLAVELAIQARKPAARPVKIAGSLPPLNTSYRADLVGEHATIVRKYAEILEVLGPITDLIIIESMASSREAIGALEACKVVEQEVWISFTLHGNRKNTLPSGESLTEAIEAISTFEYGAMLINCCATNQLSEAIKVLADATSLPFGGYANPERIHTYSNMEGIDTDPEDARKSGADPIGVPEYLTDVEQWIDLGANIIGGCCRTRPDHIRGIRNYIDTL